MLHSQPMVARTEDLLRRRVICMLDRSSEYKKDLKQLVFEMNYDELITTPTTSISEFLGYICDAIPTGDLYLFGGVLRDLALLGRNGFASDIDLVVDGDWAHLIKYLDDNGFSRNRFGGFRGQVDNWLIDIWNSRETWAIKKGLVQYHGIQSLMETTILNWDAILLNWRTKQVICSPEYFQQIQDGLMDIVLVENPNPLGAAVRAFRHLCLKDARILTVRAARYLRDAAQRYSTETIIRAEIGSYKCTIIKPSIIKYFHDIDTCTENKIHQQFDISEISQPILI